MRILSSCRRSLEPEKLDELLVAGTRSARSSSPTRRRRGTPRRLEALKTSKPGPLAVLIGPEGGFEREERAALAG